MDAPHWHIWEPHLGATFGSHIWEPHCQRGITGTALRFRARQFARHVRQFCGKRKPPPPLSNYKSQPRRHFMDLELLRGCEGQQHTSRHHVGPRGQGPGPRDQGPNRYAHSAWAFRMPSDACVWLWFKTAYEARLVGTGAYKTVRCEDFVTPGPRIPGAWRSLWQKWRPERRL
jgi:hypothetical protein